jgi:hypothetical protein
VDGAVGERSGERLVHATVLVDEREPVEAVADDGHLEMVAANGPVLDVDRCRVRECGLEQLADGRCVHPAIVVTAGTLEAVRLFRSLIVFKLGFWAGLLGSAALMKRVLPSRGDADSDEVGLVAIFDGIELESHATGFRGGTMFTWFGGIAVDLREATLAPDARLTLSTLWGGIAIRVPPEWHVESTAKAIGGGVAVRPPQVEVPDPPRLQIDGFALLGGIAVGSKSTDAEPATS